MFISYFFLSFAVVSERAKLVRGLIKHRMRCFIARYYLLKKCVFLLHLIDYLLSDAKRHTNFCDGNRRLLIDPRGSRDVRTETAIPALGIDHCHGRAVDGVQVIEQILSCF